MHLKGHTSLTESGVNRGESRYSEKVSRILPPPGATGWLPPYGKWLEPEPDRIVHGDAWIRQLQDPYLAETGSGSRSGRIHLNGKTKLTESGVAPGGTRWHPVAPGGTHRESIVPSLLTPHPPHPHPAPAPITAPFTRRHLPPDKENWVMDGRPATLQQSAWAGVFNLFHLCRAIIANQIQAEQRTFDNVGEIGHGIERLG